MAGTQIPFSNPAGNNQTSPGLSTNLYRADSWITGAGWNKSESAESFYYGFFGDWSNASGIWNSAWDSAD